MMLSQPIPDEWYEAPVYQVRMAAPDARGRTSSILWGKTVSLFYFTEFDAGELRERYKKDWEQARPDLGTAFRDLLARAFYDRALYVQAAWEDGRREQVTAAGTQRRKPGRPADSGGQGKCATAHRMRQHEGFDNEDVARELYGSIYAAGRGGRTEALRKASQAASKGNQSCPQCRNNSQS